MRDHRVDEGAIERHLAGGGRRLLTGSLRAVIAAARGDAEGEGGE
jgi:hypothetical protein